MRLLSLLLVPALLSASSAAHAVGQEEAEATPKGIVGGALLGAEAVMLVEAVLDVQPAWAYIVGGGAGAVAGGVGGYFIDQMGDARLSILLLTGGMALAIPTTVAVLSATAYEYPADYVQDRGPADEPVAEPPMPETELEPAPEPAPVEPPAGRYERRRPIEPRLSRRSLPPPALFGYDGRVLSLGVPALELRDVYSATDRAVFGVRRETELRVPLLALVF